MRLDLTQLRHFFEAVRLGSYTEAARRLHVTQSAISHAVSKLEQSVGVPLVVWRARRLALTDEGEMLHQTCERVFAQLEELETRLASQDDPVVRTIRIGAPVEFGAAVLLRKLRPFIEDHPELHLDFHLSHQLLEPLLRKELDLAVDCRSHLHPDLERTDLFREKYCVVAAPVFLARQRVQTPLDLGPLPVLSLDKQGQWWGNLLGALPEAERPVLRRIVEVNHLRGIIHAAQEGLGLGLVPKYAVLRELAESRLEVLFPELPLLEDRFSLYQRRSLAGRPGNRLVTQFLASLDMSELGDAIGAVSPP